MLERQHCVNAAQARDTALTVGAGAGVAVDLGVGDPARLGGVAALTDVADVLKDPGHLSDEGGYLAHRIGGLVGSVMPIGVNLSP